MKLFKALQLAIPLTLATIGASPVGAQTTSADNDNDGYVVGIDIDDTNSLVGQDSTQQKKTSLVPQFNYVEAGLVSDKTSRVRSFTTNDIDFEGAYLRHAGFHEVYNFEDFFTRNAFLAGTKTLPVSAGIAQSFTKDGALPTEAVVRYDNFPNGFYGFLDISNDFKELQPKYTFFAGKDVGKFSLWYFGAGSFKDVKNSYNELQTNYHITDNFSAGARMELLNPQDKPLFIGNISWTF